MKKYFYLPLFILLFLSISGCGGFNTNRLEATNEALSAQVETLTTQLAQQAGAPAITTQASPIKESDITVSTSIPPVAPSSPPEEQTTVINSALIYSGSGTITPWTNQSMYSTGLFGAANVHMICDPNGMADGKMWIDKETETASCGARGEAWSPWKQDITIGDHYIYSANANDQYEFWTVGNTPFTIRNKYSHSDFIFTIQDPGIYTLSANLIKGEFNVYITCQEAQNFNYKITQSTSYQVVLNPATCQLIIRDVNQAKQSNADIEVSLEFTK